MQRITELVEIASDGTTLQEYISRNRRSIVSQLCRHGSVVFTGFGVQDPSLFAAVRNVFVSSRARYVEAATPRSAFGDDVFSSTDYPSSQEIALHNENSYARTWPRYLLFGCIQAPAQGGETPVADVRAVLNRLPGPIVDEFLNRGWRLVRTYGTRFGLPIEKAFGTSDRGKIERYCDESDLAAEWLSGGVLRTTQIRPVTIKHPVTGETSWFNHIAFWHSSRLAPDVREILTDEFGEDRLPFNTFFGDGGKIPDDTVAEIVGAYNAEKLARPWEDGDVMIIDNMLAAHGREPFAGDRKIVVAMGDECRRDEN